MACFSPLAAWRSREVNESGKRPMVFNPRQGEDGDYWLPCGKCEGCRAEQAREWSVRMYHESQCHAQNAFLTLTYDDEHYPEDGKLNKKHLQDFIKRMRKEYQFRYFAAGEYGENTRRAHYHMLVFGQDFLLEAGHLGDDLYENLRVTRKWGHGNVVIGEARPEAMSYVAGYCAKKIGDSDTFSLASTVPPLGYNWFTQHYDDVMRTGSVIWQEKEWPVPKAYFRFANKDVNYFRGIDLSHVKDSRRMKAISKGDPNPQHLESKQLFVSYNRKLREEKI